MLRRLILAGIAAIAAAALAACSGSSAPQFRNTDITGANYGESFSLTDHHGQPRTLADYRGKVVTLFFGFTQCPDVCPTSLATMREVMTQLGDDADRVQVLFVTVDPDRDTEALLANYVPAFDARFVGLYGSIAETDAVAKAFRVFFRKSGDVEGPNYSVDHTAGTYVFDPRGRLRLYVRHAETADNIAADLRLLLAGR